MELRRAPLLHSVAASLGADLRLCLLGEGDLLCLLFSREERRVPSGRPLVVEWKKAEAREEEDGSKARLTECFSWTP